MIFLVKPVTVSYFKREKWWANEFSRAALQRELYAVGHSISAGSSMARKVKKQEKNKQVKVKIEEPDQVMCPSDAHRANRRLSKPEKPEKLDQPEKPKKPDMEESLAILSLVRMPGISYERKKEILEGSASVASLFEGKEKAGEPKLRKKIGSFKGLGSIEDELAKLRKMDVRIVSHA